MPVAVHDHLALEDHPAVAAVDDGGPTVDPGFLTNPGQFSYEVVQGHFVQNGPKAKHLSFAEILDRSFGLLDNSPQRWANLKAAIRKLQASAPPGVQYKLLFLARHGQGWHNFGASKYGAEEWEAHWTFVTGDGELTWGPDPELTPLGVAQARAIHRAWRREAPLGAPIDPSEMRWFVSPLTRTGQTMLESWGELLKGTPEVWEDWREIYGSHTCDQRSSRSYIAKRFPTFKIESSLTEEDELWKPDYREDDQHMQERATRALDRLFGPVEGGGAPETFISITSHSAFLRNVLAVLRHQPYPLATGELIPVIVKATPTAVPN